MKINPTPTYAEQPYIIPAKATPTTPAPQAGHTPIEVGSPEDPQATDADVLVYILRHCQEPPIRVHRAYNALHKLTARAALAQAEGRA